MRDLLPLAVILPVLAACVLLAGSRWMPRRVISGIALASVAGTAGLEIALLAGPPRTVLWVGGWRPVGTLQIGVTLVADRLGTGAALTAALLLLAAAVYGAGYFDDTGAHYPVLLLLFLAGMTGFALTGDLFNLFVFFELMSASAYALTGMKIEEPPSVQGALNFGVLNSLGAYLSLLGVGLIYARTGQLGLAPIGAALDAGGPDPLVTLSFALVCVGLLVKAAAVPLHFWLADAHAVAPTPVCVLFSGIMIELGLYGVVRLWFVAYSGGLAAADVSRLLLVLGVATAVVGAVMCSVQRHIKRLLAYSTVSHSGLFLVALATLTPDGVSGAALYVLGHAAVKAALFLLAGVLLNRFGSVDEAELFARATGSPLLAWGFVVGALALAGLPPFGTGLGKAVSEEAAGAEHAWLVGLFVVVSAVTGGSVLRAALRVFFGLGEPPRQIVMAGASPGHEASEKPIGLGRRPPLTMLGPIAVLLGAGLALGCWPGAAEAVARAAAQFTDHSGYLAAVFGRAAPPAPAVPETGWTASGVLLGLLSTALAAGLAAVLLRPPWRAGAGRLGRPPVAILHRLHSGHLGDYVAWLVLGTAAVAALLGLTP